MRNSILLIVPKKKGHIAHLPKPKTKHGSSTIELV